jgi:hypothetical protein
MAKKQTKKDYTVSYWHQKRKYNCKYCAFDTFDYNELLKHVEEIHKPKKPVKTEKKVPIKDRFGQQMVDGKGNKLYKTIK